jgi:hypothetical protein
MSDNDQEAFGFENDAAPKGEKYNTRYLVSNLKKDRTQQLLIWGGGTIGALVFAGVLFAMCSGPSPIKSAATPTPPPAPTAPAK